MNNLKEIIEWGTAYLVSNGHPNIQPPELVLETPWSKVLRFASATACYYLKQTPPDLFVEADVIEAIRNTQTHAQVPTILSKNLRLNCFLMNSCGSHSLRTEFNGTLDPELLLIGIKVYIHILRGFEQNVAVLNRMGIPDWRINQIPTLYQALIAQKDLLLIEGLSLNELKELRLLEPKIKAICDFLSTQKIAETLVNCDFNENNIIMNQDLKQIYIIDWGESVITHPFFTIASHLQSISRRYGLAANGALIASIQQTCLSWWSDVLSKSALIEAYRQIIRLHPIFSALSLYRLQMATQNKSKKQQRWFIAGCLQNLIQDLGQD